MSDSIKYGLNSTEGMSGNKYNTGMAVYPETGHVFMFADGALIEVEPDTIIDYDECGNGSYVKRYKATNHGIPSGLDDADDKKAIWGICFDPNDSNILYFSTVEKGRIWKYDFTSKAATRISGNGNWGRLQDGPMGEALFDRPRQICMDSRNNIYVADQNTNTIRKIDLNNETVSTIAGAAGDGRKGLADGSGEHEAKFSRPTGIVMDSKGNLYVWDNDNLAVRCLKFE